MARTLKLETLVPTTPATEGDLDTAPIERPADSVARVERLGVSPALPRLEPIPTEALEGLGLVIVGMVQIATDSTMLVVPVGLAPFAGSDTVDVPRAGFFLDELGRCGILLNGHEGAWQKALPEAVEEARRAFAVPDVS